MKLKLKLKRGEELKVKGFTLIELLIVIAILGILVALILPRFSDVRSDANTKVCVANLRGMASAMAIYETRENTNAPWGSIAVSDLVNWEYIAAEPICPYAGGSYTLSATPDRAACPNVGSYTDHVWP